MADYDFSTISQRLHNGYNYWRSLESFVYIRARERELRVQVYARNRPEPNERKVTVGLFNENLIEDAPVCGMSSTTTGLIWTSLLPLRQNQYNYNSNSIRSRMLSHKAAQQKDNQDRQPLFYAFLPEYKTPEQIRSDILHGRTLGGAISQRLGLAVDSTGNPVLFFQSFPIGDVNLEDSTIRIYASGWSYFKSLSKELEPTFKLEQQE